MSRVNLEGLRARDIRHGPGFQYQNEVNSAATGTPGATIDANSPTVIFCNPAGAATWKLPTSTDARRGLVFIFANLSGNVVTFNTDTGVAFATAITVAANAATRVVCTGNSTPNLGWIIW